MTKISRLLAPVGLWLLAACAPVAGPAGSLPFKTLEQKNDAAYIGQQQYYALDPGLVVLEDRDAVDEAGVLFSEAARRSLSEVNWQTQFVLAVFQGWKLTGGYGVTIENVSLEGQTLRVDAVFSAPGESPTQAVTSPYHAVVLGRPAVPAKALVVELRVSGKRLAVHPDE